MTVQPQNSIGASRPTLDELYLMVAHIYGEQNINRSTSTTFSHFVEVCGMLTIHDRKKRREGVTVTDALCKALGWYFPLLAKMRIRSIEEVIFRKFPYACPYCRKAPHQDAICKLVRGTSSTVDHVKVQELYELNTPRKPRDLDGWQQMFQDIYPREADDRGRSTIGLLEEIGELAEALRVYEKHPKYFIGEVADTFSYLMGIANEHALRLKQDLDVDFSLEKEFLARYPGLCIHCGSRICVCPAIPEATVGRLAKELDIRAGESLFITDPQQFSSEGRAAAQRVFEIVGGYGGLTDRLLFDRGDANHALLVMCLRVADAIEKERPDFAEKLRSEAVKISTSATFPGSRESSFDARPILSEISSIWRELGEETRAEIRSSGDLLGELGDTMEHIRVLVVSCSPKDISALQVQREIRAVRESVEKGPKSNKLIVDTLPAATADDLRRALLKKPYEIIHFAGHANSSHLVFETASGTAAEVPLAALDSIISRYQNVRCVILNGCESAAELGSAISPITIGMASSIEDEAAIAFATGFYDALAAGKDIPFAFSEGVGAVEMAGLDARPIRLIHRKET